MPGFNFYIDGALIDGPDGFQDFTEELFLDSEKRILRFDYPIQLTFVGNGRDALEAKYQENLNSFVTLQIRDDRFNENKLVGNCIIRMVDCEWNLNKFTVLCDINDATYQSRIFNNLKSEVYCGAEKTISGEDMPKILPIELAVFNVNSGVYLADTRKAFDLKDVFSMVIAYLSDNTVGFESTWYDELPGNERIAIATGLNLRTPSSPQNTLASLQRLFDNAWKKYNLYLIITDPLTNPILRLETAAYLFQSENVIQIQNVADLKRSLDFDQMYSTVRLGSTEFIRDYDTAFGLPYFQFFGFSEETYTISGINGGSNELDLVSSYVIDTNVIQDIVMNGSDEYDDDMVFVQYDLATSQAVRGLYYLDRFLYNEQLLNSNVAQRFSLYGDLILNSGILDTDFQAEQTISLPNQSFLSLVPQFPSSTVIRDEAPWPYDDDSTPPNFDEDNAYDPATFKYTAPYSGIYRFFASVICETTALNLNVLRYSIRLDKFRFAIGDGTFEQPVFIALTQEINGNPLTQLISVSQTFQIPPELGYKFTLYAEKSIFLVVGETIEVEAKFFGSVSNGVIFDESPQILGLNFQGGRFGTIETPTSGGDWQTFDPNSAFVNIYSAVKLGIEESEWEAVRVNPVVQFNLDTGNNDPRIAYGKRISRNFETGETEIELLYNRKQQNI